MGLLHGFMPAAWVPSFSQLIQLYYSIIIAIAIASATLPSVHATILNYGKLDEVSPQDKDHFDSNNNSNSNSNSNNKDNSHDPIATTITGSVLVTLKNCRVPKRWFNHFYVLASLWMAYMTADLYFFTTGTGGHYYPFASLLNLLQWLGIIIVPENSVQQQQTSSSPFSLLAPSVLVAMAAYQLHALRRWYETWNIERPSPTATINIGHYLIGITFYAAIAPALWIDAVEKIYSWNHVSVHTGVFQASGTLTRAESIQCLVGLTMFLWASWHQHRCHCILANLRAPAAAAASTEATTTSQYKVPFGDWFRYMVTPHYSAEMLIYFGLYIMVTSTTIGDGSKVSATRAPSPTLLIACVWTVINLGVVSRETDAWYKARFGPDYSGPNQSRRRILIPFVY